MSDMFSVPIGMTRTLKARKILAHSVAVFLSACMISARYSMADPPSSQCKRAVLLGEVEAGHTWSQPIGRGWVFKLLPIKSDSNDYSGWDLAVDRVGGAGYPDALLLATPPYASINEREIGTTFGLRAQDAIGWNPRSFHFITNLPDMRKGQKLYFKLRNRLDSKSRSAESGAQTTSEDAAALSNSLMDIAQRSSAGQFRILDARLMPGTANALPYAQNWALQLRNTPHTVMATTSPTPYGKLVTIKFEITLWLPANWKLPKALQSSPSPCR